MDSLLRLPPDSVINTFRDFSKHASYSVRCGLASALGDWRHPESRILLHNLIEDRDSFVRAMAASSLGALKDLSDLPLLQKMTTDKDARVRMEAVWAIGQYGKTAELDVLKTRLNDEAAEVRMLAGRALAQNAPRLELQKWFNATSSNLKFEALKEIDYLLYAPRWLRDAEKRARDDYSSMETFICRHELLGIDAQDSNALTA
jgi:hypothetical protein